MAGIISDRSAINGSECVQNSKKRSIRENVPAEAPALAVIGNDRKDGEPVHLWIEKNANSIIHRSICYTGNRRCG